MILPIVAFGNPILRKVASDITPDYAGLQQLIADMWETMYASNGVGLAAPQIDKGIRLFIVDSKQVVDGMDDEERAAYTNDVGVKSVFINAKILSLKGKPWTYNEGCLSIPKIREDVDRNETVELSYMNEHFEPIVQIFRGISARIILHEYDHIEGKLFIDHISSFKRRLLKNKLEDISKGKIEVAYRMLFNG